MKKSKYIGIQAIFVNKLIKKIPDISARAIQDNIHTMAQWGKETLAHSKTEEEKKKIQKLLTQKNKSIKGIKLKKEELERKLKDADNQIADEKKEQKSLQEKLIEITNKNIARNKSGAEGRIDSFKPIKQVVQDTIFDLSKKNKKYPSQPILLKELKTRVPNNFKSEHEKKWWLELVNEDKNDSTVDKWRKKIKRGELI